MAKHKTEIPKWYDTPPSKNMRVLLFSKSDEMYVGHWVKSVDTGHEGFCIAEWGNEGDQAIVGAELITHWMPLPCHPVDKRAYKKSENTK